MYIHYVTGSRADFGLMRRCLTAIHEANGFELGIIVTGQHLSEHYGYSISDIVDSGLPILHQVPVKLSGNHGAEMALAMSSELTGFCEYWKEFPPDLVLVLGDRGEMVAASLAAVHLGIFVAHIHGGERSGTLDESFRHVITKLAHFHFPVTEDAAERIRLMGEMPESINVLGAPGLVGISDAIRFDKAWLCDTFDIDQSKRVAVVVFHPVVQEAGSAGNQIRILLESLKSEDFSALVFRPNSDAGGSAIDEYLDGMADETVFRVISHVSRGEYLNILASSDLIIGNSSSGIIESASFGIPCVNIGSRQSGRLRNNNTVDCLEFDTVNIINAINLALSLPRPFINEYGDGKTDERLVQALARLNLDPERLKKSNVY